MSKPLILLPVEVKIREFDAKMLFAAHAACVGYQVVLGDQNELVSTMARYGCGYYLDKSVTITKEGWFRRVTSLGHKLLAWDEEGLVVRSPRVYLKARIHPPSLAQVSRLFTWGPDQTRTILSKCPDARDRIAVTGNPRFDLLRPFWRGYYAEDVAKIREEHGSRLILVNTNHGYINHYMGLEGVRKIIARYPLGEEREFQMGWFEFQRRSFEDFKAMIPLLSRAFPGHVVIVRPSHSENRAPWMELVQGLPNVRLRYDGNVMAWIQAAEAVLHFNCTTGVEAYLLDKPAIALRSTPHDAYEAVLPKAVSWHAFTPDEAVQILRDGNRPALQSDPARQAAVREFVEGVEGPCACERVLSAMEQVPPPPTGRRPLLSQARALFNDWWVQRSGARQRDDISGYYAQKFDGLEQREVDDALRRLTAQQPAFERLRARRTGRACYAVTDG